MKYHLPSSTDSADRPGSLVSRIFLLYSLAHALINVLWLVRRGGKGDALRAAVFGVGIPALAEGWITSVDKLLVHRMSPKVLGVPLAIPLLWFNVIFGSLATVEVALEKLGFSQEEIEKLSAPAAALSATSLDLVMDCFGLDSGLWEWRLGGPYARDVIGANGERGIPVLNFIGWISLVWTVVYLFGKTGESRENKQNLRLRKATVLALVPCYLVSVAWSLGRGKWRFVIYSLSFPVVVLAALGSRS